MGWIVKASTPSRIVARFLPSLRVAQGASTKPSSAEMNTEQVQMKI